MLYLKEMACRTMIVRYEDVAVEPFTYAAGSHVILSHMRLLKIKLYFQRIRKHVGLEYKDEVINWIERSNNYSLCNKIIIINNYTLFGLARTIMSFRSAL